MMVVGRIGMVLLALGWLVVAGCDDRDDLVIITDSLPNGKVGINYTTAIVVEGDADEFRSLGDLPPGLQLVDTGVLFGRPTVAGTFTFTIEVFDLFDGDILDRTSQGFSLVINP